MTSKLMLYPSQRLVARLFVLLLRRDWFGPGARVATPAVIYLPEETSMLEPSPTLEDVEDAEMALADVFEQLLSFRRRLEAAEVDFKNLERHAQDLRRRYQASL